MSKKPLEQQAPQGWNFQLNKLVGKGEGLKDPLGYRVPMGDIVVRNSTGKTNLTQLEVLENVSLQRWTHSLDRKLGSSRSLPRSRS